jgi:iron-sulfur cluster repair protein YtfE (RIC family)
MHYRELHQLLHSMEEEHRLNERQLMRLRNVSDSIFRAEGPDYEQGLKALEEISHFFRKELCQHFADEERELFPLLREWSSSGSELVRELEHEHQSLREQIDSLASQLALLQYATRQPLLFDLVRTCWEVADALSAHGEKENAAMRQWLLACMQSPRGRGAAPRT